MELYKWSGAGNKFVVLDGRGADASRFRDPAEIGRLCAENATDGLMILTESPAGNDFAMEFYNPDGSSGMMCGNGGRCIVAFAASLGIEPGSGAFVFDAPDGVHTGEVLRMPGGAGHDESESRHGEGEARLDEGEALHDEGESGEWIVRLGMRNVEGVREYPDGLFLDTGTRHFVKFVPNVEAVDIEAEAVPIRWAERFAPEGVNVNFAEIPGWGLPVEPAMTEEESRQDQGGTRHDEGGSQQDEGMAIKVRTFEKGVEGETLACGTGITAVAIACRYKSVEPLSVATDGRITYRIKAREATLQVDFLQSGPASFKDIYLTGPATIL